MRKLVRLHNKSYYCVLDKIFYLVLDVEKCFGFLLIEKYNHTKHMKTVKSIVRINMEIFLRDSGLEINFGKILVLSLTISLKIFPGDPSPSSPSLLHSKIH